MIALRAEIFAAALALLLFYGLGRLERRRWDGKVPTIREYMFEGKDRKRSSIIQLRAAMFGRRVLVPAVLGTVIGGVLMIIGAVSRQ